VAYYGLSKTERIKKNREIQAIFEGGRRAVNPYFALHYSQNGLPHNRVGAVAGRKLGGAVVRNRLKRLLREVYRRNKHTLCPGYDLVLVARSKMLGIGLPQVEPMFRQIVSQVGLLRSEKEN